MLLLDTHAWVWSKAHDARLGRVTERLLNRAAIQNALRVSPVSFFEVATLHANHRIHFDRTLEQWIVEATQDVRLAELTPEAAIDAGYIVRSALPDPMDRLLVATARRLDAMFITADRAILAYARGGEVRVHDASR